MKTGSRSEKVESGKSNLKAATLLTGLFLWGLILPASGQAARPLSGRHSRAGLPDPAPVVPAPTIRGYFAPDTTHTEPYPAGGFAALREYLEAHLMAGPDTTGKRYRTFVWNIRLWVDETGKVDSAAYVKHRDPLHAEIIRLVRQVDWVPGTDHQGKPVRRQIDLNTDAEPRVTKKVLKKYW